jgi:hypothetical protein
VIPYIVAGVVALVLLVLAYRSFGGAASRPPDPIALMRLALDGGETVAAALAEAVAGSTVVSTPASAGSTDSLRGTRRLLDGCGQQLQQLDPARLAEPAQGAHALLTVAIDELAWALRLLQTPGYAGGEGMQAAVADLRSHAGSCLSEARGMLPPSGAAEEIGGAL